MRRMLTQRLWLLVVLLAGLAACRAPWSGALPTAAPASTVAHPTAAPWVPQAAHATQVPVAQPRAPGEIAPSRTAEGYHVLGAPDAPVTITFYSDFL